MARRAARPPERRAGLEIWSFMDVAFAESVRAGIKSPLRRSPPCGATPACPDRAGHQNIHTSALLHKGPPWSQVWPQAGVILFCLRQTGLFASSKRYQLPEDPPPEELPPPNEDEPLPEPDDPLLLLLSVIRGIDFFTVAVCPQCWQA